MIDEKSISICSSSDIASFIASSVTLPSLSAFLKIQILLRSLRRFLILCFSANSQTSFNLVSLCDLSSEFPLYTLIRIHFLLISIEEAFYRLLILGSTQQLVSYKYVVRQLRFCLTSEIRANDLDSYYAN